MDEDGTKTFGSSFRGDSRLLPLHADQNGVAIVKDDTIILPLRQGRAGTHLVGASLDAHGRSELLRKLIGHDHPAIVPVRAVGDTWLEISLVTGRPLLDLGDTPAWLRLRPEHREAETLDPDSVDYGIWSGWMRQLTGGLRFLNRNGIAHNDAFPYNVRVNGDSAVWIDLADVNNASEAREADHFTFVLLTIIGSVLRRKDWSPSHIDQCLKSLDRPGEEEALLGIEAALGSEPIDLERADPAKIRDFVGTRLAEIVAGTAASKTGKRFLRFLAIAASEFFDAFTFGLKSQSDLRERLRLEKAKSWMEEYERGRLTIPKAVFEQEHRHNKELGAALVDLRSQFDSHLAESKNQSAKLTEALNKQTADSQRAMNDLHAEISALRNQSSQSLNDLETASRAADAMRAENAALREQAAMDKEWMARRIDELASTNADMMRSTSWRVTKPLRAGKIAARSFIRNPHKTASRIGYLGRMVRNQGWRATARWLSWRLDGDKSSGVPAPIPPRRIDKGTKIGIAPALPIDATPSARPYRAGLVSIILPIYNQANFLVEAIDAVERQSYRDWELIIVNDGSSDGFEAVIAPHLRNPKIRVFSQPNQKLPSALNNGFREARGEFLTWTSADNVMLDNQIERLVAALKANPDAGFAYSDYTVIGDDGDELKDPAWRQHNRQPGSARLNLPDKVTAENFHESGDNFVGASFLWRAEVHDVVGMHNEHAFGGEDYDFWLRMNVVTNFVHVPENLYLYRVHDNTLNARHKELKLLENVRKTLGFDRQRREMLLRSPGYFGPSLPLDEYWRDANQYRNVDLGTVTRVRYTDLPTAPSPTPSTILVIELDVSLREIDLRRVSNADILTTSSPLTHAWLRQVERKSSQRLIFVGNARDRLGVEHAIALRRFERLQEAEGVHLSQKPPARPAVGAIPQHILFAVGKWRNGGMEQVVVDLATGLVRNGTRVSLACCDEMPSEEMRAICERIGLEPIGFDGSSDRLRDFVRANGIEVVNYHHASLGADKLADDGVRTIYTLHNSYVWFSIDQLSRWADQLSSMTGFIAVSRQVAEYANRWLDVPPDRLTVIPNGTDLGSQGAAIARGKDGTLPPIPHGAFRFLNAATFNRVKCQDRLLRAFSQVVAQQPNVHLTLVGEPADSEYFAELVKLRDDLGLNEKVSIIDGTARSNVHSMMQLHDCFVLPSIVEGWSISLAEAALSAMVIITTDVGSARDMARMSEAVLIVPPLAPDLIQVHEIEMASLLASPNPEFERDLARAMIEAIRNSHSLRGKATAATPAIESDLSIGKAVSRFLDALAGK